MKNILYILVCVSSICFSQQSHYLVINPDGHRSSIYASDLDQQGHLVTGSFDKTVKVWDLKKGYVVREFFGQIGPGSEGMIYALDVSPDNKYLAVGGWFGKDDESENLGDIRIYNYRDGQLIKRIKGHENVVRSLKFTDDSKKLVSCDAYGQLVLWNYLKGTPELIYETSSEDNSSIDVHTDYFISCHPDGMVYMWNYSDVKPLQKFNFFKKVKDVQVEPEVRISEDGEQIFLIGKQLGMVVELDRKMKLVSYFFSKNTDEIVEIAMAPSGNRIACSHKDPGKNKVIVYDRNGKEWSPVASYKAHDDIILTVHFINENTLVSTGGSKNEVAVWEIKKDQTVKELLKISGVGTAIYSAALDSTQLAFSRVPDKAYGFAPYREVHDIFARQILPSVSSFEKFSYPIHEKETYHLKEKRIVRKTDYDPYEILYLYKNKKVVDSVPRHPWDGNRHDAYCFVGTDYFVSGGSYGILEAYNYKADLQSRFVGHDGDIRGITISSNGKFLVTASTDMTIRFWSIAEIGKKEFIYPVASMFIASNNEWVIWNNEGYFTSSKKGAQYVGYHVNQGRHKEAKYYPFDQFDLKYNRPDIILKDLQLADTGTLELYERAYQKRLKRMGIEEQDLQSDIHAPLLRIQNFENTASKASVSFIASDEKYELDRIHVFINDVPVYGRKGIDVSRQNTQLYESALDLELMHGENKIQLSALNKKGVESYRETIYINNPTKDEGDLYVISIGVSNYKDSKFNLNYAAKDAEDIVKAFENNERYATVHHKILINENVTKENILEMHEFLKGTQTNDVVMLFIAGHGVLDKNLDYYYCTYDVDFQKPEERGISYTQLETLFDGIKAIRKLLIMDTCHSGELDKEDVETYANTESNENEEVVFRATESTNAVRERQGLKKTNEAVKEMFNDLNRGTGATVISSAGGVEYAMESETWKNGLFTYCLLNGLRSKLADLNNDGQILISELQQYIRLAVNKLSNGKQTPGSRFENIALDYVIW
jgi:WD40 repeat protein/uncharacterized caspase-like protein